MGPRDPMESHVGGLRRGIHMTIKTGWDGVDHAMGLLYGEQEPTHWGTALRRCFDQEDQLEDLHARTHFSRIIGVKVIPGFPLFRAVAGRQYSAHG